MATTAKKPPVIQQQTRGMGWQELVSFNDVTVHFTIEEWSLLNLGQKRLYKEVMIENYGNVAFLNAWYANECKLAEHYSKRDTSGKQNNLPDERTVENLPPHQMQTEFTEKLQPLPLQETMESESRELINWGPSCNKNTIRQGIPKQEDHRLSGERMKEERTTGSSSGFQITPKEFSKERQGLPALHPQEPSRMLNSVEALQQISFCKLPLEDQLRIKRLGPATPSLTLMQVLADKGQLSVCILNREWYDSKKWLCGSTVKNALFCFPCLLFGGEESWTSTGVRDLQHLVENIKSHEASESHVGNCVCLSLLGRPNIVPQRDKSHLASVREHNQRVSKHRYALSKIIDCILFCGAFEVALDGQDKTGKTESSGAFRELVHLVSSTDSALKFHLQSSLMFRDLSTDIHEELLDCMLVVARNHIKEQLKGASFVAVEVGDVASVSFCKQAALILRYVNKQGIAVERFYGFVQMQGSSARAVASALLKQLEEIFPKNADKRKLIAQSYDGAIVQCGEHREMQKIIRAVFPNAHYVHCYTHHVNVVMQQAASHIEEVKIFFADLAGLVDFFAQDPQRSEVLKSVAKVCFPRTPQTFCNIQTVSEVFEKRQRLIKCFEQIRLWDHNDAAVCAAWGFKLKLEEDGVFLYLLSLFHKILPCLAAFCLQLQKAASNPAMVRTATSDFVKGIMEVRKSIETLFSELPPESRLGTGTSKETLDQMASEVCHALIKHGKERFAFTSHLSGVRLVTGSLFPTYNRNFPQQILSEALEAYPMLEKERLRMELSILYKREELYTCRDVSVLLCMLLENNLEWSLEQTVMFLRILITTPLPTAELEQTSVLSRIRTFLQNNASKHHLSALAMLSVEKEMVKEIPDFHHRTIELFSWQAQHQAGFLYKK